MSDITYNIGIVEDNKMLGELLAWRLQKNPEYNVKLFYSGEDLLQKYNYNPDLMIVDYHLNGENPYAMNGLQLARRLDNVPIIVFSEQKELSTAVDFIHHGACDYVIKDENATDNVEKSIKKVINHLKQKKKFVMLKWKSKKDLFRMSMVLLSVMVGVLISYLIS